MKIGDEVLVRARIVGLGNSQAFRNIQGPIGKRTEVVKVEICKIFEGDFIGPAKATFWVDPAQSIILVQEKK